jgi:hypothetical protein
MNIPGNTWKESGRSLTLEFPITTPGMNSMKGWREAGVLKSKLRVLLLDACWGQPQFKKARITYTRFGKKMDRDNCYSSAKIWIDRIKNLGIIPDDTEEVLDLICKSEIGKPKTVIEIRECV